MIRPANEGIEVWLCVEPVDFRKQITGLATLVQDILRLAKTYSDDRLEAAAQRALTLGAHSVRSVESILKHRLDEQPLHEAPDPPLPDDHDNLRDPSYFH